MYLTFEQYRSMGGTLDETAFLPQVRRAESFINAQASGRTGERIEKLGYIPECVTECAFELTELIAKQEKSGSISKVDRTVGGVREAVSYNAKSAAEAESARSDIVSRCFYGGGMGELLYLGGMI